MFEKNLRNNSRVGSKSLWFVNYESIFWFQEPKICKISIFHKLLFPKYDNFKIISTDNICLSLSRVKWSFRVICLIPVRLFRVVIFFFKLMFIIFIIANSDLHAIWFSSGNSDSHAEKFSFPKRVRNIINLGLIGIPSIQGWATRGMEIQEKAQND